MIEIPACAKLGKPVPTCPETVHSFTLTKRETHAPHPRHDLLQGVPDCVPTAARPPLQGGPGLAPAQTPLLPPGRPDSSPEPSTSFKPARPED